MANKILTYVDEHLENFLVFPMYFIMMALMAIGVIQRFFSSSPGTGALTSALPSFAGFQGHSEYHRRCPRLSQQPAAETQSYGHG